MADYNSFDLFSGNYVPPSQTGLDINAALIKQLGERRNTPEFRGPGAWMGAASDAVRDIAQQYRMNQLQKQQAALSGNTAAAAAATRGATQPQPQAPMPQGQPPQGANPITTGSLGGGGGTGGQGTGPQGAPGGVQPPAAGPQGSAITPAYLKKAMDIESGGNPRARSGSHVGLYQFSPEEWAKWGNGGDIYDPKAQLAAFTAKSQYEEKLLSQRLGRPVTSGELYLAHQQGVEGAYRHLTNPDAPAWENMYATAEGQQKGPGWARKAIAGNVPSSMLERPGAGGNITSGRFANYWTSRFDKNEQPMHLGGEPNADREAPPGPQLAQADQPNQTSDTGATPGRGYTAPRLESPQEFQEYIRQLSLAGAKPEQIQEIVKNYIERSKPVTAETPAGRVDVTAQGGGQPPLVTQHPEFAKGLPITLGAKGVNIGTQVIPQYDKEGNYKGGSLVGGDVAGGGKGGISSTLEGLREEGAKSDITEGQAEATKKNMADTIEAGGTHAQEALTTLKTMKELNKNTGMPGGPTHEFSMAARQFIDNIAPGYLSPNEGDAEVFKKLQTFVASEYAKTLSSRVSNFNFRTFLENTPNLTQTQRGRGMLIDLMEQELNRRVGLSKMAQNLPNNSWRKWNGLVDDYYQDHYPILHDPDHGTVHLKQFGSKEEMQSHVKKGERFLLNDGTTSKPRE